MKKLLLLSFLIFTIFIGCAQSFPDLVTKVNSSVVTVQVLERKNMGIGNPSSFTSAEGMGSGVLVGDKRLYVLTAAHVVANASKIQILFANGSTIGATNRRIDRTSDVALLQLNKPANSIPPAKIGDSEKMRIGDEIFIIGNPLGLEHSVSTGIISGKHSEKSEQSRTKLMEFFQTDASINKGNSGGPMFNMQGEVVGIVSSILSFSGGFEGLGFAATSSIAKEILSQTGRIWFGTDIITMNSNFCKLLNVPQEGALLVQSVAEDSPGYFMGLKGGYVKMQIGETEFLGGGDIILQFDDIPLNSEENMIKFFDYLNAQESGKTFRIKIFRAGEIITLRWILQH